MNSVPRRYPDSTVVCIGGGPSLTAEDVAYCQGKAVVVAINDAYRLAPWAEVLYGCDEQWWQWHQGAPSFTGLKYTLHRRAAQRWPDVQLLRNTGQEGLELDASGLRTGRHGGYQAINVAVHLGAKRIVLLGYDLSAPDEGPDHWFGSHPNRVRSPYTTFLQAFGSIVEPLHRLGIAVMNCTRRTALTCFPCVPLIEALG